MTRLPGFALQVRVRVAGFFDRASCPGEKLARILAGHPSGFPSPARRCHTGTPRAKSQEPRAKSQSQSQSQSQKPKPKQRPKRRPKRRPKPKRAAPAQRQCEASPRFKSSAIRARCAALGSTRCVSRTVSRATHLKRSGLSPRYAAGLSLCRPFSLGYFSFGPAKEK